MKEGNIYEEPRKKLALIRLEVKEAKFWEEEIDTDLENKKKELLLDIERCLSELNLCNWDGEWDSVMKKIVSDWILDLKERF